VSDPDSELRVERYLAGRGEHPSRPAIDRTVGDLVDRLADRLPVEADTAELPLPDGSVVRVVALGEVEQWLRGCAIRLRAGEHL
jgi:hypothetical protein